MRSAKVILTLSAIGMMVFIVTKHWLPASPEAMQVHSTILAIIGTIAGLTTTFTFQAVGKMEKLHEARLSPIQLPLFRDKIGKRKHRLWLKWGISLATALVAIVVGQYLKLYPSPLLMGVAYAALSVTSVVVVLLMVEYWKMAGLVEAFANQVEGQRAKREFFSRLRHHPH